MKLDNFRLLVNDFAASFHFWHDIVGLSLIFKDDTGTYAYLQADVTYADLVKRGAPPLAAPQRERAGFARTAHLLAPDGYVLEVFNTLTPLPKEAELMGHQEKGNEKQG